MMRYCGVLIGLAVLVSAAPAQSVAINGAADDVNYGAALASQDTQTGFGDSSVGRPDIANGSELDGAYAFVYNNKLYLTLAGNFETNGNWVEIFFDTRAGGQNRLLATNPGAANTELLRMSDDGSGNGLTFDAGFEPDFWVSVNCYGSPVVITVEYAELYVNAGNPGVFHACGTGSAKCTTSGGALTGGDVGAPAILCTVDNSNTFGVTGGYGPDSGAGVTTGLELAIPLSAIGNPAGAFNVCAFINGRQHDSVSNQTLGGSNGTLAANPGEPRAVDFSTIYGNQYFTVPAAATPVGACCKSGACDIQTQTACVSGGGSYLGDNTSCDGNPCDATASGACCFDDGYSGLCLVMTEDDCAAYAGTYKGNGTTCEGCPCLLDPKGACCVGNTCSVGTQIDCNNASGTYVGDFTNCDNGPCDAGACCDCTDCTTTLRRFECTGLKRFVAGGNCASNPCTAATIATPYVAGDFNGWNAGSDPMTETTPGSRVWQRTYTTIPVNERHEFKITQGDWSVNLPPANSWLNTDGSGTITITYDSNCHDDGWSPNRDRLGLTNDKGTWTAVGDYLSQIGGVNWNNSDAAGQMVSVGGGRYVKRVVGLGPATYHWKAVVTGTWDSISWDARSVNTSDMQFAVDAPTDIVKLWVNALDGAVRVDVLTGGLTGDMNCDGVINNQDIDGFIDALFGLEARYETYLFSFPTYHPCDMSFADFTGDGFVNNQDIDGFITALFGP